MTVRLTEQQRSDLWPAGEGPPTVVDPVTNIQYVLLPVETYQRVMQFVDWSAEQAYPAIDEAFREGWNAPGMSDYDRYEEIRP